MHEVINKTQLRILLSFIILVLLLVLFEKVKTNFDSTIVAALISVLGAIGSAFGVVYLTNINDNKRKEELLNYELNNFKDILEELFLPNLKEMIIDCDKLIIGLKTNKIDSIYFTEIAFLETKISDLLNQKILSEALIKKDIKVKYLIFLQIKINSILKRSPHTIFTDFLEQKNENNTNRKNNIFQLLQGSNEDTFVHKEYELSEIDSNYNRNIESNLTITIANIDATKKEINSLIELINNDLLLKIKT